MVRVIAEEDCGNAPKKRILRDFNIAYANGDTEFVLDWLADDITWTLVGERRLVGKDEVAGALEQMLRPSVEELVIDNIITHGWTAAANGKLVMKGGATYAFCDVYRFAGAVKTAKIKAITSYIIQLNGKSLAKRDADHFSIGLPPVH